MKQHTDTKKCESDFKLHSTGQEVLTKPPTEGILISKNSF